VKPLFEAIGHKLGQKAAQAKEAFDLMGGTDEEALKAEVHLGANLAAALLRRIPLVEENPSTVFAAQIGRWLASNISVRKLPFSVRITAEYELNAVSLPGGPVLISWPLLETCEGLRDQIAFLIAHEMGHIALKHAVNRIVKDAALSLLLRQTSNRLATSSWLGKASEQLLGSAYSRAEELEADIFAAELIKTAGGDPSEAENLLHKLSGLLTRPGSRLAGPYARIHPSPWERLENLRSRQLGPARPPQEPRAG